MIASSYSNQQALSHLKDLQLEWQPHPVSPKRVQQRIQTCHGSDKQCIDRKRFKENGTLTHKDGKKNCIPLVRDSSHIFETFSYSRVLDCTHKWFPSSGIELLLAQDSGWWFDALVAAAAAEDVVVLHAAAAKSQTLLLACNPYATSVEEGPGTHHFSSYQRPSYRSFSSLFTTLQIVFFIGGFSSLSVTTTQS